MLDSPAGRFLSAAAKRRLDWARQHGPEPILVGGGMSHRRLMLANYEPLLAILALAGVVAAGSYDFFSRLTA